MRILVLGGARSGKSARAQMLAETLAAGPAAAGAGAGAEPVFVATAQAFDDEMRERIARHRADRGARWRTVEVPRDLAATIRAEAGPGRVVLVDCLTLWLSNLLVAGTDADGGGDAEADLAAAGAALVAATAAAAGPLLLVSNEVGWGIVPDNPLARRFRDEAGRLHQRLAAVCDRVELVVAGLPLCLKGGDGPGSG